MRIPCPYCGDRDIHEFIFRGDAAPVRPATPDQAAYVDYAYFRDNPAGAIEEHWYHANGCRSWLVVDRDTMTHEIAGARLASEQER